MIEPFEMYQRVASNLRFFNGRLEHTIITRNLNGLFVGVTFESVGEYAGEPNRIWHVIKTPDTPWPRKD